ncbi:putative heavy metal-binding protein, partial [Eubacteriales bacterium DFI.9.88]|nr:putative heavy metal-binding protein [Eubacteriales bacterium DFI.9.88]
MVVTTTNQVEGKRVVEYKDIVFGEVITGINFFKDIGAGLRNMFGGRSQGYEDELCNACNEALEEMKRRAAQLGANAVIGVDIDYEVLGADNGMLMV